MQIVLLLGLIPDLVVEPSYDSRVVHRDLFRHVRTAVSGIDLKTR
jgi:hypothetical protein